MPRRDDVTRIKGSLELSEEMQNGKMPSHPYKGESASVFEQTSRLTSNRPAGQGCGVQGACYRGVDVANL